MKKFYIIPFFSIIFFFSCFALFYFNPFHWIPSHETKLECKDIPKTLDIASKTHVQFKKLSSKSFRERLLSRYLEYMPLTKFIFLKSDISFIEDSLEKALTNLTNDSPLKDVRAGCDALMKIQDFYVKRLSEKRDLVKSLFKVQTPDFVLPPNLKINLSPRDHFEDITDLIHFYKISLHYKLTQARESTKSSLSEMKKEQLDEWKNWLKAFQYTGNEDEIYADFLKNIFRSLDRNSYFFAYEEQKELETANEENPKEERIFYLNRSGRKIGVLQMPTFGTESKNIIQLLEEASDEKIDALLVDISFNSGGRLKTYIEVLSAFIAEGSLSQRHSSSFSFLKQNDAYVVREFDKDTEMAFSGPVALLFNGESASASELLAATLKDYGRAILIGSEKTLGKGSAQYYDSPLDLKKGEMRITKSFVFSPSGKSPHVRGVNPHIVIPSLEVRLTENQEKYTLHPKWKTSSFLSSPEITGESKPNERVEKGQQKKWQSLRSLDIDDLRKASLERVKNNEDLQNRHITLLEGETKKIGTVSELLSKENDEKRKKQFAEEMRNHYHLLEKEDYLNDPRVNESLNILVDMLEMLDHKLQPEPLIAGKSGKNPIQNQSSNKDKFFSNVSNLNPNPNPNKPYYSIQVASYPTEKRSDIKVKNLQKKGMKSFYLPAKIKGKKWFRVFTGRFKSLPEAKEKQARFAKHFGMRNSFIKRLPPLEKTESSLSLDYSKTEHSSLTEFKEGPSLTRHHAKRKQMISFLYSKYLHGEYWWLTLLLPFFLAWGLGLVPSLLIRFVLKARPLQRIPSLGIVLLLLALNVLTFIALGSQSKTHITLILAALISYKILRIKGRHKNAPISYHQKSKAAA